MSTALSNTNRSGVAKVGPARDGSEATLCPACSRSKNVRHGCRQSTSRWRVPDLIPPTAGRVGAKETVKNMGQADRRGSNAVILNRDHDVLRRDRQTNVNPARRRACILRHFPEESRAIEASWFLTTIANTVAVMMSAEVIRQEACGLMHLPWLGIPCSDLIGRKHRSMQTAFC